MNRKLLSLCSLCCAVLLIFGLSSSAALAEDDILPEDAGDSDEEIVLEEQPGTDADDDDGISEIPPVSVPAPSVNINYASEYGFDPRGIDNRALLLGWLMDNGYTHQSAAAIAGNLQSESFNINPLRLEGGVGNYRDYAPESFRAINRYGFKTYVGGFGISQWTSYGRVLNLQNFADNHNLPVTSIEAQVRFLVVELARYNLTPEYLNALSFEEATFAVYRFYLTPGSSIWTWHYYDGRTRYFNDYSPTSYSGGPYPLSEYSTPSAYRAFTVRFDRAVQFMDIEPDRGQFEVFNLPYIWINNEPVMITEPKYTVQMYVFPDIETLGEGSDLEFIDEFISGESDALPDIDLTEYADFNMPVGDESLQGGDVPEAPEMPEPTPAPKPTDVPKPTPEPIRETVEIPLLNLR